MREMRESRRLGSGLDERGSAARQTVPRGQISELRKVGTKTEVSNAAEGKMKIAEFSKRLASSLIEGPSEKHKLSPRVDRGESSYTSV